MDAAKSTLTGCGRETKHRLHVGRRSVPDSCLDWRCPIGQPLISHGHSVEFLRLPGSVWRIGRDMAYEISVNLEYAFQDAGESIEQRIDAAAAAGFRYVELFLLKGRDLPAIREALERNAVKLVSTVADYATQLVDPQTHEDFCAIFRKAAQDALFLGCSNVVVTSGRAVPWLTRPVQLRIFADALTRLLPIAEELGVTIYLESANTRHDHPGVLCSTTQDSVCVVEMLSSPHVRLIYDLYHSVVEGEDPAEVMPRVMHLTDHVQIGDVPGRGEPGSGTIDWPAQLALLKALGYKGLIGLELKPTRAPTADALSYIQQLCAVA
ncbi:TIM barrel protein [Novosphingobium sp. SG707]|uniref:TIM barrel protein n=1 Tax=Novosphingobium sp. SG707 TaxID=2586996 RepID=UPI0017B281B2|nr:TIM barrel protein [Novosphingobium sp. SG707]